MLACGSGFRAKTLLEVAVVDWYEAWADVGGGEPAFRCSQCARRGAGMQSFEPTNHACDAAALAAKGLRVAALADVVIVDTAGKSFFSTLEFELLARAARFGPFLQSRAIESRKLLLLSWVSAVRSPKRL